MKPRNISIVIFFLFFHSLYSQEVRIDHVIAVYNDLENVVKNYEDLGFTLKQGYKHKNGLINAHIKFKNGTSVELISVSENPIDKISKTYASLLKNGEGGVFIALSGLSVDELKEKLKDTDIKYSIERNQSWDYVTFNDSNLEHLFFISYKIQINDSQKMLIHKNDLEKIGNVWIEGNDKVKYLFKILGMESVGFISDNEIGKGEKFKTSSGDIVIIPFQKPNLRPRVKAISFSKLESKENILIRF